MSAMGMPWTPMCGESWAGAAASFLAIWMAMMAAMMLPSLVPMLRRYRRAVGGTEARLGPLTVLAGVGYFAVWSALGVVVFPIGAALAAAEMRQPALLRAAPLAVGAVVLIAGALQLTAWKVRRLARCRETPARALPADAATALRHGLRLGLRCVSSCAGLTAVLLALGVMDLRAMALVTSAITAERLAPAGERVARAVGAVAVGAGLLLIARAASLP